jgi:hypothetical protein
MRRMLMLGLAGIGVVTLITAMVVPAGAQPEPGFAPLTIEKDVEGPVPEDTEFTVRVECDRAIIFTGLSTPSVSSVEVDFDEDGDPEGSNVILFASGFGTCTVTETEDGDAEDVSYECEGQILSHNVTAQQNGITNPCATSGPQEDPMTVHIVTDAQSATVTVTNEFEEPEPEPEPVTPAAQAVVVEPTFTG